MYNQNAWVFMVLLKCCHTNGDVAAQGVELGAQRTKWIPHTIPRSFPRMSWSLLKFDSSIPEAYAYPSLSCNGEGFYSHPFDCTKFYRCINEFRTNDYSALSFKCAEGTIFSQELGTCVSGTCSPDGVSESGVLPNSKVVLELNSPFKSYGSPACLSEGRIADPDDCGQFYDCVRGSNGDFIASKQSCFDHAFDAKLKECVPVGMAKGCIPDPINGLRSVNVEDLKLQNLCVDNVNKFFCLDCKTLVLCLDRLPQIVPCKYGNTCYNDTKIFRGGVCYPNAPVKCTCNNEDIFRPDIYDPSKFLSCGSQGAEPVIQSCPEGLEFNEEYSSCGAPINTTCSVSGTFTVQSDCTKYHTCTYTTSGSLFNSMFTCNNNTMFNKEIGKCEDPCDWYSGNYTCEKEGRFPNPEDCTKFFECIKDPLNTEKFIKIEHTCRDGYEWLPLVNEYHCVAKGTTKEDCVPKKPNSCNVPREWCISTTDLPTTMAPTTRPPTTGPPTTRPPTAPPTTNDTVTTTQSPAGTPANPRNVCPDGHFQVGSQCFFIPTEGFKTWYGAQELCMEQGGILAEPDSIPEFHTALSKETSGYGFWLGGSNRKQGGNWRWSSRGAMVGNSNSWYPGGPNSFDTSEKCLFLMRGVEKPLAARSCDVEHHYFICEKH